VKTIVKVIDSISEYSGRVVSWACIILFVEVCYDVIARYVFNAPTMWSYETSCMLGITIATLGWAYTHKHHGHIRVDLFYEPMSPRNKAIVDIVCGLTFFPAFILLAYFAALHMLSAWSMNEVLSDTFWYPPAGPIKTVVFLGMCLFILQGLAQFIRDLYLVIRSRPL